jgi:hypothetical protein
MAVVIISCAICSVFGGSLGFLLGAICTMASDKNQRAEGEVKSSVGKRSIVLPGTPLLYNGGRP